MLRDQRWSGGFAAAKACLLEGTRVRPLAPGCLHRPIPDPRRCSAVICGTRVLRLYDFLFSGNGYRVRLTLRELGIRFVYQEINLLKGETREPWFLGKNPAGQIPVLELENGTCIAESTAILFFLAEGTHLLPEDKVARTRVLQWMCFEQTKVNGVIARARFRRKFPDAVPTRPEEFEPWLRDGTRTLRLLDSELHTRPFIAGTALSIADLALYSYVHRASEGGFPMDGLSGLQRWFERIEQRPRHISIDTLPT
jgi:glutathione S-transferase